MIYKEIILSKSLNKIRLSRQSIKSALEQAEYHIEAGNIDGVEVLVFSKYLEELAKSLRSSQLIRESYLSEIDKGVSDFEGCKVEKAETGVKYDFKDSPAVAKAEAELQEAKETLKAVQEMAKKASTPQVYTFSDGEILAVRKPIKRSTTSPKITLKAI